MRKIFPALAAPLSLLFAGCAPPIVTTPPPSCSSLIPSTWATGVGDAPLPDFAAIDAETDPLARAEAEARGWMQFGVAQTGRVAAADGRTTDTIHIFSTCEAMQRAARPRRRLLGIF